MQIRRQVPQPKLMNRKSADIQSKLAHLQHNYARQLPAKVQVIEQAWQTLIDAPEPGPLQDMIRLCHTLAGSGASYGFEQVTRVCRAIEQQLRDIEKQARAPDSAEQAQIQQQLQQLQRLAEQGPENRLKK